MRHFRQIATMLGLALVLALIGTATPAAAARLSGTFTMEYTTVGVVVGFIRGQGTLSLTGGKTYAFTIEGITLATAGISSASAKGRVFNLRNLSDFAGDYLITGAGITFGVGAETATLRNEESNVIIDMTSKQVGLRVSVGGGRVTIKLKDPVKSPDTPAGAVEKRAAPSPMPRR
jgi:hypothetical protein